MTLFLGALDDDKAILYTLEAMASLQGWNMKTTLSPSEALGWVRDNTVDIMLIDLHMPIMSGLEVVREARKISSTAVLLVLTVEESTETAESVHIAGADDFISKPVRLADFASRIALHAELGRYRREGRRDTPWKGISESITRKILEIVRISETPIDAKTVAEISSLSYPAAHRYLEFLVAKGSIVRTSRNIDGKPGRPRSLYHYSTS